MLKSTDLELALTTLRTVTLVHKRCLSFPATEARYKYPMNNLDSVRHTHNPKKKTKIKGKMRLNTICVKIKEAASEPCIASHL